ncbi:UPF0103-domain-containing protein [Saccharata proteae CBS 121410]|uniref:UPF0103-domain-containing protein n=1 Tax=Saccharata proteae CBS 121410 TaxID=1314787 RepID=A0A6A5YED3_9PEZI|nr:UPF0103-domain-containing protein [Saccharata proteae CBS 121410]
MSREASHAGSWYSDSWAELSSQLDGWLAAVPDKTNGIRPGSSDTELEIPSSGARAIIAPHAGYAYSGPAAAWAYKALDLSKATRIFLLGPSHHKYLPDCALTKCHTYETPLGDLKIDVDTVVKLQETGKFARMSERVDEAEHSLEMHLPYIYKVLLRQFSDPTTFPRLVPILVGATTGSKEKEYGEILAPYLADPTSIFIVSSDFAHWGSRFEYTYYESSPGNAISLSPSEKPPKNPPIYESIANVDGYCMDAVESKNHKEFLDIIDKTKNTVCGRHPIGVMMAAVEALHLEGDKGKFRFVRYERSSDCVRARDSSVSYCSAFAVL